jgi:hypothetical protein
MVRFRLITMGLGFGLQAFGFFWSLFDRFLCDVLLCGSGNCSTKSNFACFGLFLFVGIIFILCGYALITMKPSKKEKLKRKISRKVEKWRGK